MAEHDLADDADFTYVAEENGRNIEELLQKFTDMNTFLSRNGDNHVCIRRTTMDQVEQEELLEVIPDVDGIVVQWNNLTSISHVIKRLQLTPRDTASLQPICRLLRKHLDLVKFSSEARSNLQNSLGCQIIYVDGWEYWIGLIPIEKQTWPSTDFKLISTITMQYFKNLREYFKRFLKIAASEELAMDTMKKNNLNDPRQFSILPDDSATILNILQKSVDSTKPPHGWETIVFSHKLGEKSKKPVKLPSLHPSAIHSVTIHIAATIYAYGHIAIFWSRLGLQEIVGQRGSLTTASSLCECANFQSNLDGRLMDVTPELRRLCNYPERLRFIQLYSDLPHRYPKCRQHPVSGSILYNPTVCHSSSVKAFEDASTKYLSEVENNMNLIASAACRIEFVLDLTDFPSEVRPLDYLNLTNLSCMLKEHALIVPFFCEKTPFTFYLKTIGCHLVNELKSLHDRYISTGNTEGVWKAFQLELAIEKLLWGHPLASLSNTLSINLGPGGSCPSRCKSDTLGFLALEPYSTSMSSENSTPPLALWTKSQLVQKQLKKLFGFHDYLHSPQHVVGRRAVLILLQDLFDIGDTGVSFGYFLTHLKGKPSLPAQNVSGSISGKQLAHMLCSVTRAKYPMVWMAVLKFIRQANLDCEDVVRQGLDDLDLQYFPSVRVYDASRHSVLTWKRQFLYWRLTKHLTDCQDLDEEAAISSSLVTRELEQLQLIHTSKLRGREGSAFPWMKSCIRKLKGQNLSEEDTIKELTFLSCIAFLQNGWFVDYNKLADLSKKIQVPQCDLKVLEIQSKFSLASFNVLRLFRLHETIPFKVSDPGTSTVTRPRDSDEVELVLDKDSVACPTEALVPNEEESVQQCDTVLMTERHHPVGYKGHWLPTELELLHFVKQSGLTSLQEQYRMYQGECLRRGIADRAFPSFRAKMYRIR